MLFRSASSAAFQWSPNSLRSITVSPSKASFSLPHGSLAVPRCVMGSTICLVTSRMVRLPVTLKSPLLRVGGEGDIDIGNDTINYLVKAAVVGTLTGQDGRPVNELKGVTVPVRATGPLTAPSFGLDFNALLTDTVKQKAEDMVKGKLEDAIFGKKPAAPATPGATPTPAPSAPSGRDAAKDVLKGIFGR